MAIKITDLVDPNEIEKLKQLDAELSKVLDTYTKVAKDLAKGLEISVSVVGDIDRLEKLLVEKGKEATNVQQRLTQVIEEQGKVIANTTNTCARQLMEQERVNKTQREAYTEHDRVKKLLDQYHDTYDGQINRLVKLNAQLDANKKAQKDNEKALSTGRMSMAQYQAKQAELVAQHRSLTQEKRTLTQLMTAEEKAAQSQEGSYVHMSQQLELLKKAYKDLSEEGRDSDFGKELEASIQNLDAHLKDMAADMGEYQRNVGNYAIAGQNGVVATQSLIEVMNQEAVTTQDLIDQNKILEEGLLRLDRNDDNYAQTVQQVNDKLEENKSKLRDVSNIIDKQATSVHEAEEQNKRLKEALAHVDLTSEGAKEEIEKLNAKIAENTRLINGATGANDGLVDQMLSMTGLTNRFGSSLQQLSNNSSGSFIDGLKTKTAAFGKTLTGLLANPYVIAFLGIAGTVAAVKWWYDYNKGLIEASRLTQNFTGLTGAAADKITSNVQGIADSTGHSYEETINSLNTLTQQFGISWDEALKLMKDGYSAGADMSGQMMRNIDQFAPAMRDAGVSASEFVSILAETRNGIFNERGVQDIIKGGTRLRAMTKQISESLDAVGISSKQMQQDLADGNITMLDAVQQVAGKLKELPENSQEAGMIMKNVFGRAAAEGGVKLIQSIADVNTNLDEAKIRMGELGKANERQVEAQTKLNENVAAMFKISGTGFEVMTTNAKAYITEGLNKIIEGCIDTANWFIRIYNNSMAVRGAVQGIGNSFKIMWEVTKFILNNIISSLKSAGTVLEGIFTLNWDKIKEGVESGMQSLKDNYSNSFNNIWDNVAESFNKTMNDKIEPIKVNVEVERADDVPDSAEGTNSTHLHVETEEEKKARLKAMEDELKDLYKLEESKVNMMEEGHEKELAKIRLQYQKKLAEIKIGSKNEQALRVQLLLAMDKELLKCENEYQKNRKNIDLANALESTKDAKEILNIKLQQLYQQRSAELEEAEKLGADTVLIEEKYFQQRIELWKEFSDKRAQETMSSYANEQEAADIAYLSESAALERRYAAELKATEVNEKERTRVEQKYEKERLDRSAKYGAETAQRSIEMIEAVLNTEGLSVEEREKYERQLATAKANYEKLMADQAVETIKKIEEEDNKATQKRIENAKNWIQVASNSLNSINELISAVYDAKISKVEEEQEANTAAGEAEQERIAELVEKKVITEEEGEARKRAAEAQTAKKNEELEKKKQQLKHKQAVWDKANSIAQAGIATSLAIMNALQMKPFPLGIAMAAIAGAMGAVQIATILATPIPKYAKGTDRHKGGPAVVGDGGVPELVIFGGKSWITPDTPTVVDLPAGAVVKPNIDGIDDLTPGLTPLPLAGESGTPVIINNDYKRLEEKMDAFIFIMRRHSDRQYHNSLNNSLNRYISDRI